MKKILLTTALVLGMATCASANYNYEMGAGSDVTGNALTDPGLVLQYIINPALDAMSFDLAEGASANFLFASFYSDEGWINSDDKQPQTLQAQIDFDSPDVIAAVDGSSVGDKSWWDFLGIFQNGEITWDAPAEIDFGYMDTGHFTLTLSDASFYLNGILCMDDYANVYATLTHVTDPVPEPGTMMLMGLGLAGLAGFSRRRKQ